MRLTGEDGYQAQRSYSIASAPDADGVELTVERLDDGEVSPYLAGDVRAGDTFEMRGPIGGYFVWTAALGGPLLLIGGGSGVVPLMAMLRHRAAAGSSVPATLIYSSRSLEDVIYATNSSGWPEQVGVKVVHTPDARAAGGLERLFPPHRPRHAGARRLCHRASSRASSSAGRRRWSRRPPERCATSVMRQGAIKTERFGPTGS